MQQGIISVVAGLALFFSAPVWALGLSLEAEKGASLSSQTLSADGDIGGDKDHDAQWGWNASSTLSESKNTDSSGQVITDNSTDLGGGLDWLGENNWGAGGSLQYSATPDEGLSSRGGQATLSYKWKYLEANKDDDYHPSLTFKLSGGQSTDQQKFSGSVKTRRRGVVRPVTGQAEIKQSFAGLALTWRPVQSLRLTLGSSFYHYDKDVAKFESQLDSPLALQRGSSGFSSTVGGLPKVTYTGKLGYDLTKSLSFTLSDSVSTLAADESQSSTLKGIFDYELNPTWTGSLGAEGIQSDALTDTLGIVGVAVNF